MKNLQLQLLKKLALLAFFFLIATPLLGQVRKTFTQRSSYFTPTKKIYNIQGDFQMIGNTNMTLESYSNDGNNSSIMKYVDIDGDPTTVNSSSAELSFSGENDANDECTNIIYAGLYWTGRPHDGGSSPEEFTVGSSANLRHNNAFGGYDLVISNTNPGSYVSTYTFTPEGAGQNVVFTYTTSGSNVNSVSVSVGGGTPLSIPYSAQTGGGGLFSNPTWIQVNFTTPYVINTGSTQIIVRGLRKRRNDINDNSNYYAIVESVGTVLNKRKVKFKHENGTYVDVVAQPGDIYYPSNTDGNMYSAYAEVTSYVRDNGLGNYFLANLAVREGNGGGTGYYGGWGMIVVYENSKMKWRDVTIFDGHAYVASSTVSHELPVSGFNTAQDGPINMKLGLMAGEGDRSISGDYFQIRNHQNTSWVPLSHSGNTSGNFFNSSVNTGGNARNPSLLNNTGLDIAMFDIDNSDNSVVTNSQTSTSFRYGSTQDTYVIFCVAMAVDAYVPDIESIISTTSIGGGPANQPYIGMPGDVVKYRLEVRNKGTEEVNDAVFTIPIPYIATYVDPSIMNWVDNSLIPTLPPNAFYDPNVGPTGSIVWNFGNIPLPPNPEDLIGYLEFDLKITENCFLLNNPTCPPTVEMTGSVSGVGATSGSAFNIDFIQGFEDDGACSDQPIKIPLVVGVDAEAYVLANCIPIPEVTEVYVCNYTQGVSTDLDVYNDVKGQFPSGIGFFSESAMSPTIVEYTSSNPFPLVEGAENIFYAIPYNSPCYYVIKVITRDPIILDFDVIDVTCQGAGDGSIDLTVANAADPYKVDWIGPNGYEEDLEDISGLSEGTYSVTVNDALGCIMEGSVILNAEPDVTDPTITCPADISVNMDAGSCFATGVDLGDATANDDCSVPTVTNNAPTSFPIGETIVTWTATDAAGNTATCTQTVTVVDNQIPVFDDCINAQQDVVADAGVCTYTHVGTAWDATATDNCGIATIEYNLTGATSGNGTTLNGVVFEPGTTTVTWTVTDESGNAVTCSFDVVNSDDENPSILTCINAQQEVETNAGMCTFTQTGAAWDITADDNCGVATITYVLSGATTASGSTTLSGVEFEVGTTTVTWTVTDNAGNIATCTFDVVVTDDQDPSFTTCGAAGNQTVSSDAAACFYTHVGTAWDAVATDNCGSGAGLAVTYTLTGATTGSGLSLDGVVFNLGTTTVTWTATDEEGNVITCSFDVLVEDTEDPSFIACGAVSNQSVSNDAGSCTYVHKGLTWDATATDNCTVSTIEYVLTGATSGSGISLDGVSFDLGTTTVTWTVTDAAGNTEECSFTVTVNDTEFPIIDCLLANPEVVVDAGECMFTQTTNAWDPSIFDNCSVASVTYELSGATTATGSTTLVGVEFGIGTTTVTWTVVDGSGNEASCSYDVIVTDTQAPVIAGCVATNPEVVVDAAACTFTQTTNAWDVTATDNCTVSTVEYELTGATTGSGTTLVGVDFNLGTTTVTWTVTDGAGNETICTFDVIVTDTQFPAIADCQITNPSVVADAGVCTFEANTDWDITVTDNCSITSVSYELTGATTASGTGTSLDGVVFNLGTTTVTWTVTDGSGNETFCTFDVTVNDTQDPVIVDCINAEQDVVADAGVCTYTHVGTAWDATATDNCGIATIEYELTGSTSGNGTSLDGVVFESGTTTVTWTVTDESGNVATCSFDVVNSDDENPVISGCTNVDPEVVADAGVCTFEANTDWDITADDNCGVATIEYELTGATTASGVNSLSGVDFELGTTTVTWTVTDIAGNISTCEFDVTVADDQAPIISGCTNVDPEVVADAGVCTFEANTDWDITATDNCGIASIEYELTGATTASGSNSLDGVDFELGTTTVTWTVTDESGNISTCEFDVTVADDQAPIINDCPSDIVVDNEAGECSSVVTWEAPTFTDNCDGATMTSTHNPGDVFDVGTTTVTYTVVDGSGNETICSFDVTVEDNEAPVVLCPADISTCDPVSTWEVPEVSDNCGIASVVQTAGLESGSIFPIGATTIEYTVTDIHGNETVCSFVVNFHPLYADVVTTDVLCYGDSNGSAQVVIEEGAAPYTYNWSNGANSENSFNMDLTEGLYSVSIVDANGCELTVPFVIEQPDSLVVSGSAFVHSNGYNVSLFGYSDGSIDIEVDGGSMPYDYSWTGPKGYESSTGNVSGLTAGDYYLTVIDENGCVDTLHIFLDQPYDLDMPEGVTPNGDGDNDYFVVRGLDVYPENDITIYNRWGNIVYKQDSYENDWYGLNNKGNELPDGTYFVVVNVQTQDGAKTLTGFIDLRRN
ncbi:MAG TPA: HYR domain-containing protein [Brumimicrobium sp.]|nr:HYR domain-containing protein [Brumimicrobium sp.]